MNKNGRTLPRAALLGALLFSFSALPALDWPVLPGVPAILFGQRYGGVMSRGLYFPPTDMVRAAGNGTVLVTLEENRNFTGFPGTLGNAIVLVHDEGLATVYGNLASVDRVAGQRAVETQSILGATGSGAWGEPGVVSFEVLDLAKRTVLNPLLLLPAFRDTKAPRIRNVVAVSEANQTLTLGASKYLKQGRYRLYADVGDSLDDSKSDVSPFRITVMVNGKEELAMPFEIMKAEAGSVFLSRPEFSFSTLYADPERIFLGEIDFMRGKTDVMLIVRDFAGNERSAQFALVIE